MSTESSADRLVARNVDFAASFSDADLPSKPRMAVAVVACMDTRLRVHAALGLKAGEAHVLRNAGGVITDDVIRSLCISQRELGTREIVLIHHTDCGLTAVNEEQFIADLEAETDHAPSWPLGAFEDPYVDVRESIARLRASPFLSHNDCIRGFVYDVADGRLHEVRDIAEE